MNVLAQIGVAAAVAVPVFAWVNAKVIVFREVSSDAPAVIPDPGCDVFVWTSRIGVADGEIETVSRRNISFKIGVEDVRWRLRRPCWVTRDGPLARLNADKDDNQKSHCQ